CEVPQDPGPVPLRVSTPILYVPTLHPPAGGVTVTERSCVPAPLNDRVGAPPGGAIPLFFIIEITVAGSEGSIVKKNVMGVLVPAIEAQCTSPPEPPKEYTAICSGREAVRKLTFLG